MPNMSYCRFENTYRDLLDCINNLNDSVNETESHYRQKLVDLCQSVVDEYDPSVDLEEGEEYDEE